MGQRTTPMPVQVIQARDPYLVPSMGKNVFLFGPEMDMKEIQHLIDTIFSRQATRGSEFSTNRCALLFKPGRYELDVRVGYYMQVMGLGESPRDVVIEGAVRSNSTGRGHVLTNFWRSVENLTIVPAVDSTNVWGVSQAAPMRRVYIKGNLQLHDHGYASGGFLADSRIEGEVDFGPQQQWFSRNSAWKGCSGGAWNILSAGGKVCINPTKRQPWISRMSRSGQDPCNDETVMKKQKIRS